MGAADQKNPLKASVQALLGNLGYRIVRLDSEELRYRGASHDESLPPPAGAAQELRGDHPRLLELRERYASADLPMRPTMWDGDYLQRELDLTRFRGDNAYVWQFRNLRDQARLKYYLFAGYVEARDRRGLLRRLTEDGAFGCWTFRYQRWPMLSRDLLDSVNELGFLDRHWGLFGRRGIQVLDIGAGYGRMAHRMLASGGDVQSYYCTDAVPESTFLSEYYLKFRGCLDRACVVPLDELDRGLRDARIDLAMNIHSFSEMSYAAIEGWLALLRRLNVRHLFIVPNEGAQLLSVEADRSRRDCMPLVERTGFRLKASEPVFADADVRELMGVTDMFLLFERAGP